MHIYFPINLLFLRENTVYFVFLKKLIIYVFQKLTNKTTRKTK